MAGNNYKEQVVTIVTRFVPRATIFLYGSRAKKKNKSGSDIDIALDIGEKIAISVLGNIEEALEESNIPVSIDVVDVHMVSADFLNEIKKDWIVWYSPKNVQ